MNTQDNGALRALEIAVGVILGFMVVFGGALLAGAAIGQDTIPGVNAEVCVSADPAAVGYRDPTSGGPAGLGDGVRWAPEQVQLCDPEPTGAVRALGLVAMSMALLAPIVFFALLFLMLRRARTEGVFADRVPGALRTLGGVLLVWAVLEFMVNGITDAALINALTEGRDPTLFTADFPWLLALLGVGLLALSTAMAQAVSMRQDVEATI